MKQKQNSQLITIIKELGRFLYGHFGHAINTAADIFRKEGFLQLIRKFFRYYILSIVMIPTMINNAKKVTRESGLERIVDFALADNYGVLHSGQIRSEIFNFLSLVDQQRPNIIVEIGTNVGGTFFMLSRVLSSNGTIISIDLPYGKFGGGYHFWKIPLYRSFAQNSQQLHLIRKNSHSEETLNSLKEILGTRLIDVLFIDGDHSYEGVKKDFEMYSSLVRPGGIIGMHDISHSTIFPECQVDSYWNEIKVSHNYLEFIENPPQGWGGIGVIYK